MRNADYRQEGVCEFKMYKEIKKKRQSKNCVVRILAALECGLCYGSLEFLVHPSIYIYIKLSKTQQYIYIS